MKFNFSMSLDTDSNCDYIFNFRLGSLTTFFQYGKLLKMKFILPDDSQVSFVLPGIGLDARGNSVTLKTPPTVSVSDPAILTIIQPDPATPDNPLSGVLVAVGPTGTAQFVVKDEDDATVPLMVLVDIEVVAGEIVALGNPVFGEPVKQVIS